MKVNHADKLKLSVTLNVDIVPEPKCVLGLNVLKHLWLEMYAATMFEQQQKLEAIMIGTWKCTPHALFYQPQAKSTADACSSS